MILLIDNYDSFTHLLAYYIQEVTQEYPYIQKNDKITLPQIEALKPKYIVLSPGPNDPDQAGITLDVIQHFHQSYIPILGVCLGHQAIAQYFGACIIQTPIQNIMHGKSSPLIHHRSGLYQHLKQPKSLIAGRYHSLIIDPKTFPDCLEIDAQTSHAEIMALHHKQYPIYGIQYHPESILTNHGHALLRRFFQ